MPMTREQIDQYLQRIKYGDSPMIDEQSLAKLQKQHLLSIPFENLDIHFHKPITIDLNIFFKKIVTAKRGGFCYELNGLFNDLLNSLGFNTKLISARPYNSAAGNYNEEFDHLAIIVSITSKQWLVDVGFGEFSLIPLKMESGLEQSDGRNIFKIIKLEKNQFLVQKKINEKDWENEYLFSETPRKLEEFAGKCIYHQTSPQSHFTKNIVCSMLSENGRITMTNTSLKITTGDTVVETKIHDPDEVKQNLKKYFCIEI